MTDTEFGRATPAFAPAGVSRKRFPGSFFHEKAGFCRRTKAFFNSAPYIMHETHFLLRIAVRACATRPRPGAERVSGDPDVLLEPALDWLMGGKQNPAQPRGLSP